MIRPAAGRVLAIVAATVVVGLAVALPALAHTQLVSSDPTDGAVVSTAPERITLTFDEALLPGANTVSVNRADGTVALTQPVTPAGAEVTVPWPADLGPGAYQVAYRVVSGDGHPVTGAISFTVAATSASALPTSDASPAESGASTTPSTVPDPGSPESSSGAGPMLLAAIAIVIAAAFVVILVARGRRQRR